MTSRAPLVAAMVVMFVALPVAGLAVALLAALGGGDVSGGGCAGDGGPGGGSQQIGGRVWSAEQTANARTIVVRTVERGLPKRAAVIAVSTAIVETELRDVDVGDRDSLGLYQQRPSQGWGPPARLLDPSAATDSFYDHLVAVPAWRRLAPGVAADLVQHSAHPERYGPREADAAALVSRFWTGPDAAPGPVGGVGAAAPPACPDDGAPGLPPTAGPGDPVGLPGTFTLPGDPGARAAVSFALAAVGKPYVFGAKGPGAYDCSGLTQAAWAAAGVGISAGTLAQVHDGVPVAGLADLAPGDLLFIPGSLGTPTTPRHVGIYVGYGVIVDAYDSTYGVIRERLDDWRTQIMAIRHIGSPSGRSPATATLSPPARKPAPRGAAR